MAQTARSLSTEHIYVNGVLSSESSGDRYTELTTRSMHSSSGSGYDDSTSTSSAPYFYYLGEPVGNRTTTAARDHTASESNHRDFGSRDRHEWRFDSATGQLVPTRRIQTHDHVIDTSLDVTYDTDVNTELEGSYTAPAAWYAPTPRTHEFDSTSQRRTVETFASGHTSSSTTTSTTPLEVAGAGEAIVVVTGSDAVSHSSYARSDSHSSVSNEQINGSDGYFFQQSATDDSWRSTFDSHRSTQRIDGTGDTHYQGNRTLSGNGWMSHWTLRRFEEFEPEQGSYHMPLFPEDDRPNSYDVTLDNSFEASADTPIAYGYSTNPPVNTPPGGSLGPGSFSPLEDSQSIISFFGDVAMAGSTALMDHAARDAAFAELAEETEPSDESTVEAPSASSIVSNYVEGQGSVPMPGDPEAIRLEIVDMGNGEHMWIIASDRPTNPPIVSDDGLCPCGCGMSMLELPTPENGSGDGTEGERGDYTPEQTLAIEMILAYQQASSRLAELKRLLERTRTNWFGVPTFEGTQEQRDAWLRERDELTELLGDLWEAFRVEGLDSVPIDYHRLLGLPTPDEMSPHGSLMQLRGMGSRGMQNTGGILTHLRQMDDVYQISRPLNHAIQSLDYDLALATSIGGAVPGGFRAIVGAVGLDAAEAASGLPVGFMTAVRPRFNRTLHVTNPENAGNLAPKGAFADAMAARDKVITLMEAKYSVRKLSKFSTVVAGIDEATGKIIVKAKSTPRYRDTLCAEDLVTKAFGGSSSSIKMTPAIRPRTSELIPVCERCQTTYPQSQFPLGYGGK